MTGVRGLADVAVGDVLVLRDVNERRMHPDGPPTGTVSKVGRTLVHVDTGTNGWGRVEKYRIDDGTSVARNGFEWAQTIEQYDDEIERNGLFERLRAMQVTMVRQSFSTKVLALVVGLLEDDARRNQ